MEVAEITDNKNVTRHEKEKQEDNSEDPVLQELRRPGQGLISPSRESDIKSGDEERKNTKDIFDRFVVVPRSKTPKNPHEKGKTTYTRIYANPLARLVISMQKPVFPPGSIIVREKLLKETDTEPELVTVMIKRQKGFSWQTKDWEFFVVDGKLAKIQKRETKGNCAACHARTANTDYVFKNYLQPEEIK